MHMISPLYDQLVNLLRKKIDNEMQPNEKLPSERDLSKQYGLSRNTVRQALHELEIMGYIYRRHGKGTFVSNQNRQMTNLSAAYSFSEQMRSLGHEPKTKNLYLKSIVANKFFAEKLNVSLGQRIYKLKRVRIADDQPMMVERTYSPQHLFLGLSVDKLAYRALYKVFEEDYGEKVHIADETFRASIVSGNDAKLLEVPDGSPCLKLTRTSFDQKNQIIEYTLSVARSDQFVYSVRHMPDQ